MAAAPLSGLRRWNGLLRRCREPVIVLDARARLIFANRAWEELTGLPAEFVAGRVCRIEGQAAEDAANRLAASVAPPLEALSGSPSSVMVMIPRVDHEPARFRIDFLPFHDPESRLIGLIGGIQPAESGGIAVPAASRAGHAEWLAAREVLKSRFGGDDLIGSGPRHAQLLDRVAMAAGSRAAVLVVGESGTGRHQVARALHARGSGKEEPFYSVDLAALANDDLVRTLFGAAGTEGLIAESGTVALDDILRLPRDVQTRLVEVWPRSSVRWVGISAEEPETAFRMDWLLSEFYYGITTVVLRLPPLRDRLDELPLLAQHFLEQANQIGPTSRHGFQPEVLETLRTYDWPGNLRELRRVVLFAHERAEGSRIEVADLPATIRGDLASAYLPPPVEPIVTPLDDWLEKVERRMIEQALRRARGNKSRAAELLKISRPRLHRRIKELQVPEPSDGEDAVSS